MAGYGGGEMVRWMLAGYRSSVFSSLFARNSSHAS
jgi:hypothetical protein